MVQRCRVWLFPHVPNFHMPIFVFPILDIKTHERIEMRHVDIAIFIYVSSIKVHVTQKLFFSYKAICRIWECISASATLLTVMTPSHLFFLFFRIFIYLKENTNSIKYIFLHHTSHAYINKQKQKYKNFKLNKKDKDK